MTEINLIDQILSPAARKELQDLEQRIAKLVTTLEKGLSGVGGGTGKGSNSSNNGAEVSRMKELETALRKIAALETQIQTIREKGSTIHGTANQKLAEQKAGIASLTNVQKQQSIIVSKLTSDFEKLVAAQKLAAIAAQEAGLKYGIESKQFAAASIESQKLAKQLSTLSQASGNMGRAGMNNAYNSTFQLTQVMRELPSFAIDARIGFMSLSNNLPMLADGFQQISNSVDAMGKKIGNIGALKIMAKSLLSLNTIMIVATTLMVMFGDKFVDFMSAMFKGSGALDATRIRLSALKEVMNDKDGSLKSSIAKTGELWALLRLGRTDVAFADEAVKRYNETLGDHYGKVEDVNSAIQGYIRNSPNYIRSIIAEATATKIAEGSADASLAKMKAEKSNSELKNIGKLNVAYANLRAAAEAGGKAGMDDMKKLIKDLGGFSGSLLPISETLSLIGKNPVTKAFRELYLMEGGTKFVDNLETIIDSNMKINASAKAIQEAYKGVTFELPDEKKTKKTGKTKAEDVLDEASAYNQLALEMQPAINAAKDMASADESSFEDRSDAALSWLSLRLGIEAQDKEIALKNLKDKNLSQSDAELEREKIILESRNNSIAIEVEYYNMVDDIRSDDAQKYAKIEAEKVKAKKAAIDQSLDDEEWFWKEFDDINEENAKKQKDKEQKRSDDIKAIFSGALDALSKLYDNYYNSQADKIKTDEQSKLNALDREREAILNNTTLSAKQKDEINQDYDLKEWTAKRDAFEREKKLKVQSIEMDAAMGAVRIWASNDALVAGFLSAFLLGLTLDSIAKVNKTQYPAFATGGTMGKDGLGWVGDGHKREVLETPTGDLFLTPSTPTLVKMDKGTIIYPDADKYAKNIHNEMSVQNMVDMREVNKNLRTLIAVSGQKRISLHEQSKIQKRLN